MEVVIDANILFRILISGGEIVTILRDPRLSLLAPEKIKEEFLSHKDEISAKSRSTKEEFDRLSSSLFSLIKLIPSEEYLSYLPKAKELLKEHTKDEDFVALSLAKDCKFWTYESLMFKLGIAISTKELSTALKEELL